ncbi:MAG: hypothetical protein QMC36_06755, partial [Patescibacteria group bacterium]
MASAASAPDSLLTNATETLSATEVPKKAAIADRVTALLVHPSEVRFKDFEDNRFPITGAIQDYCNVFTPLVLVAGGFDVEIAMPMLKSVKDLGVPGIAEYFCTKVVSGGISMDQEGIRAWSGIPDSMKMKLTGIFHERYLSGFDWKQMAIVDLVEQDAYLLDLLLRGEWPDESDKKACRHFIEILGNVASRGTRRLGLLDHPDLMEQE